MARTNIIDLSRNTHLLTPKHRLIRLDRQNRTSGSLSEYCASHLQERISAPDGFEDTKAGKKPLAKKVPWH